MGLLYLLPLDMYINSSRSLVWSVAAGFYVSNFTCFTTQTAII